MWRTGDQGGDEHQGKKHYAQADTSHQTFVAISFTDNTASGKDTGYENNLGHGIQNGLVQSGKIDQCRPQGA